MSKLLSKAIESAAERLLMEGGKGRCGYWALREAKVPAGPSFFSGAVCPACGQSVALPRMTPEMMLLRAHNEGAALPCVASFMPDGSYAVAFAGVIYAMPADEWAHYLAMRRNWTPLELDQIAA